MTTSSSQNPSLKWWQSLRTTITVNVALVSIIPIAIVTFLITSQFRDRMIDQVTAQLQSVSALKTAEINTWLETVQSTLDMIAESPIVNELIRDVLIADEPNIILIEPLNQALEGVINEAFFLESLFVYDLDGNIVITSDRGNIGQSVIEQPYFEQSLTLDEFYVQPPFYDSITGDLTVIGVEPIKDLDGEVVGVVAAGFNVMALNDIMLQRTGLGDSGETYLVNLHDQTLLTPSLFEDAIQGQTYSSFGVEQSLNEINGSGIYESYYDPKVSVIGVYSRIPELNAGLMVEMDEAEALADLRQSVWSVFALTSVIIGVVVIFGAFGGQQVARSMYAFVVAAQAIASGDLKKRVPETPRNEIGLLGESFNQMADTLSQNIQELEATNRQLELRSAEAFEATRLKSEFLATMSHELRTPLNAITGFTGLLLFDEDSMSDDQIHMLQRVEANAERLLALIDDVLDLSKIEAGRVEIVSEPIQVQSLVDSWVSETSVLAEKKNIPLNVAVSNRFPETIYGDSARLTQIAKNLLSNAIKFTDEGSVSLRVTQFDKQWQIEVEDTGVGIPPHAINYIFDEFRQVDGSSRRVHAGTGLGLAITRNLVQMMNGTITVDSELGVGTVFTVQLPLNLD